VSSPRGRTSPAPSPARSRDRGGARRPRTRRWPCRAGRALWGAKTVFTPLVSWSGRFAGRTDLGTPTSLRGDYGSATGRMTPKNSEVTIARLCPVGPGDLRIACRLLSATTRAGRGSETPARASRKAVLARGIGGFAGDHVCARRGAGRPEETPTRVRQSPVRDRVGAGQRKPAHLGNRSGFGARYVWAAAD
jgi:hypothetical protein